MKKALVLSGLLLCASGVYAEKSQADTIAEGRKRNEDAYEKTLKQTGWINDSAEATEKNIPASCPTTSGTSQPKSS